MNINYEAYKVFYDVAKKESISKASQSLMISQPAISYQIKSLENQLGVTLFIRTKKGVTLTEEGKLFLNFIERGIQEFTNGENMLTNLKNLEYGTIRIGASATVAKHVLMPYLEIFHKKYPKIEIEITNHLTENLLKELRNGNLDMLLLNLPMAETNDLDIIKVMKVQDSFVCNREYYEKIKQPLPLKELHKYPLLFQKSPSNTRAILDHYLKDNKVTLTPKMEVVSYNLIMDFVKIGFGIGYATEEFIRDAIEKKELYPLEVIPKIPKRDIGVVTLKQTLPNFSVQKLINLMTQK